jgi:hypothetical protein
LFALNAGGVGDASAPVYFDELVSVVSVADVSVF